MPQWGHFLIDCHISFDLIRSTRVKALKSHTKCSDDSFLMIIVARPQFVSPRFPWRMPSWVAHGWLIISLTPVWYITLAVLKAPAMILNSLLPAANVIFTQLIIDHFSTIKTCSLPPAILLPNFYRSIIYLILHHSLSIPILKIPPELGFTSACFPRLPLIFTDGSISLCSHDQHLMFTPIPTAELLCIFPLSRLFISLKLRIFQNSPYAWATTHDVVSFGAIYAIEFVSFRIFWQLAIFIRRITPWFII